MDAFADMFPMFAEEPDFFGYFMIVYLVGILLSNLIGIGLYVMQSLGLYTISKRRGIHNPWLAWIPVANMWILGSIADQYQYVTKGKIKNRRKTLIAMVIIVAATVVLLFVGLIMLTFGGVAELSGTGFSGDPGLGGALLIFAAYLAMIVACLIWAVFRYIAFYDTFASCTPDNAVVFLVLGIFFHMLLPIFVFAVRNKDGGMPPRRVQPMTSPAPQYQPPVQPTVQPMVEPVVTAEPVVESAPVEDTSFCAEPEDFED